MSAILNRVIVLADRRSRLGAICMAQSEPKRLSLCPPFRADSVGGDGRLLTAPTLAESYSELSTLWKPIRAAFNANGMHATSVSVGSHIQNKYITRDTQKPQQ